MARGTYAASRAIHKETSKPEPNSMQSSWSFTLPSLTHNSSSSLLSNSIKWLIAVTAFTLISRGWEPSARAPSWTAKAKWFPWDFSNQISAPHSASDCSFTRTVGPKCAAIYTPYCIDMYFLMRTTNSERRRKCRYVKVGWWLLLASHRQKPEQQKQPETTVVVGRKRRKDKCRTKERGELGTNPPFLFPYGLRFCPILFLRRCRLMREGGRKEGILICRLVRILPSFSFPSWSLSACINLARRRPAVQCCTRKISFTDLFTILLT